MLIHNIVFTVVQPKKRSRTIRFADDEDKKDDEEVVAPKPTSLQQKMLAMAGQDIDQFMKEVFLIFNFIL